MPNKCVGPNKSVGGSKFKWKIFSNFVCFLECPNFNTHNFTVLERLQFGSKNLVNVTFNFSKPDIITLSCTLV